MNSIAFQRQRYDALDRMSYFKRKKTAPFEGISDLPDTTKSKTDNLALRDISDELRDMYTFSTYGNSSKVDFHSDSYIEHMKKVKADGAVSILLGANESLTFMNDVEKALGNGLSLGDALQNQYDKHADSLRCTDRFDELMIDPKTGEVVWSCSASRGFLFDGINGAIDYPTCRAIADDVATFLRYTAFPQETDDPVKVQRLIGEIKAKQSSYDISRFDPSNDWRNAKIPMTTKAEDVFKPKSDNNAIDELLELIKYIQEKQQNGVSAISTANVMRSIFGGEKNNIDDARERLQNDFSAYFSV